MLFSCVIKVFVQIELGRYAISSGKPTLTALDELPGIRFGAALAGVVVVRHVAGDVSFSSAAWPAAWGRHCTWLSQESSNWLADQLYGLSPGVAEAVRQRPRTSLGGAHGCWLACSCSISGGYKRIERMTTVLVAGVTLVTVHLRRMLPGTGYPIRVSDMHEGFSLGVLCPSR